MNDVPIGGTTLRCSSDGCSNSAVDMLVLRGQYGHVHDCPEHAHDLREWCDVIASGAIIDGVCPAPECTGNTWLWHYDPTPLEPKEDAL